MKQGSTFFLKGVIVILGLVVLGLCIFVLPAGLRTEGTIHYGPIVIGMYLAAIPFFIALYQSFKLLTYIDTHKAFSDLGVVALKYIKQCALVISGMFFVGLPYIFIVADRDDAPGVLAIAFVIVFASAIIATFAGVLQKLLRNVIDIKSENDLTV